LVIWPVVAWIVGSWSEDKEQSMTQREPQTQTEASRRGQLSDRRRNVTDQRRLHTGLERRRGPGRRRTDFVKSAEEGEMTQEQYVFLLAIDVYKRVNGRPYPTWTEVLEVVRKLGYRKTCPTQLALDSCEDWTEAADAPFASPPDEESDEG
jgi:hypothetical protein